MQAAKAKLLNFFLTVAFKSMFQAMKGPKTGWLSVRIQCSACLLHEENLKKCTSYVLGTLTQLDILKLHTTVPGNLWKLKNCLYQLQTLHNNLFEELSFLLVWRIKYWTSHWIRIRIPEQLRAGVSIFTKCLQKIKCSQNYSQTRILKHAFLFFWRASLQSLHQLARDT